MIARHTARLLDLLRRNTTERRRRRTDSALLKGRPDRFELEHRQLLATFIVNSVGDQPDYQPGDGIADTYMDSGQKDQNGNPIFIPSGLTTLRSAIQEANALGGMNTIQFNLGAGGDDCAWVFSAELPNHHRPRCDIHRFHRRAYGENRRRGSWRRCRRVDYLFNRDEFLGVGPVDHRIFGFRHPAGLG